MKILAFVDLHENLQALKRIKEKSKLADLIICAGDISNFSSNLNKFLNELNNLNKETLIIPGNHEMDNELKKLCGKFKNLKYIHKDFIRKNGFLFLGYGGSGFSMEDKEFDNLAKKFKKIIKKDDKIILITHAPVYGTAVDYLPWSKEHRGNKSIRKFIEEVNPILAVCGHFHENDSKVDWVKNCRVINPGKQGKLLRIK